MQIKTNNKPRHIIYGFELSDNVKVLFDYYDEERLNDASFFQYKRQWYDLAEFQRVTDTMENCHGFNGWHGFCSDSFFSGILIKVSDDFESVIVGQYFC